MATLTGQDLINSVVFRGYPDQDNGVSILDFLNAEYRNIAGEKRWEWLQGSNTTLALATNTASYALPMADWRNLDALFVADASGADYPMAWMDPIKLIDALQNQPTANVGPPRYWTFWGNQLFVYPRPDMAYSTYILYTKKITPITAVTSPLLPDEYTDGLVWGAVVPFAHRHHDWLGRDFAVQQRDRAWGLMRADFQLKQRQTYDHVETTGIWDARHPYGGFGWPGW